MNGKRRHVPRTTHFFHRRLLHEKICCNILHTSYMYIYVRKEKRNQMKGVLYLGLTNQNKKDKKSIARDENVLLYFNRVAMLRAARWNSTWGIILPFAWVLVIFFYSKIRRKSQLLGIKKYHGVPAYSFLFVLLWQRSNVVVDTNYLALFCDSCSVIVNFAFFFQ